jgi:HlyD family secretion protein
VSALGIEEQRTKTILTFEDTPPPALRSHGFRVDARIVTGRLVDAPRIPLAALVREAEDWVVYVVEGRKAERRVVKIRLLGERHAALESGVEVEEELVLYPGKLVASGARIAVVSGPPSS